MLSVEKMSLTVLIILLPMPCRLQFIFLLLLVGCLVVWASTKFLFLFSYPRVQVISHSFEIYCFTENIEAKSILWHPSFCYLLCIVGIGSGSEVGDYCQKNKLSDCRNPTVSKAEVTAIPVIEWTSRSVAVDLVDVPMLLWTW